MIFKDFQITCKRTRHDTSITDTPPTAPAVLALLKIDVNMKENMMRENPYNIIINKIMKKYVLVFVKMTKLTRRVPVK